MNIFHATNDLHTFIKPSSVNPFFFLLQIENLLLLITIGCFICIYIYEYMNIYILHYTLFYFFSLFPNNSW